MVLTIALSIVGLVVAFAATPVDKVVALLGWFGRVADKGKGKLVSRSQEWRNAFSKKEDSED
jgi:hypothetical protein